MFIGLSFQLNSAHPFAEQKAIQSRGETVVIDALEFFSILSSHSANIQRMESVLFLALYVPIHFAVTTTQSYPHKEFCAQFGDPRRGNTLADDIVETILRLHPPFLLR
jgi:hypothetical protein